MAAYGRAHQARRAALLPGAIGALCPRHEEDPDCPGVMLASQDLDLGHSQDLAFTPGAVGDRIEHAACNRRAGGRLGNRLRSQRHSRSW